MDRVYQCQDCYFSKRLWNFVKRFRGNWSVYSHDNWFEWWKKGLECKPQHTGLAMVCGESLSAYESIVECFKADLFALMDKEGFTRDKICKSDKTGLNYKLLP